ncbi:hypothetical protein PV10_08985 [Exophiala mesophila]|uniref:Uncharacterized protein n=1 Tax=Exophiala mesophila TaxID=212818 RepID=A0A0D1WGZ8_EXOME|nr:uncharacterized protein PV10_08985 [Exophiala mesophila]KIV88055.1 hypothetical protein PV10_08985 [Exophiala mesophila]
MDASDIEKYFVNPHLELVNRTRAPSQTGEPHDESSTNLRPTTESDPAGCSSTSRPPKHVILAPNDPSPLNPRYHTVNVDPKTTTNTTPTPRNSQNMKDRANPASLTMVSDLEKTHGTNTKTTRYPGSGTVHTTHHTVIDEAFHPAVTHETIHSHRVEVIQEEITRDIHIHHYYTYIQPIAVTEILPARHFLINPQTGTKTEIPAPQGWVMPKDMQPGVPDMGHLVPISRHYLVDEEYPTGIDEPAPEDMKSSSAGFLESIAYRSHQTVWST